MQGYFYELIEALLEAIPAGCEGEAWFEGDELDDLRFRGSTLHDGRARFARSIRVRLLRGGRAARGEASLGGQLKVDRATVRNLVVELEGTLEHAVDDPHFGVVASGESDEWRGANELPTVEEVIDAVAARSPGGDWSGRYLGGQRCRGYADTRGQRNWYSSYLFDLVGVTLLDAHRGLPDRYSGEVWDAERAVTPWARREATRAVIAESPRSIAAGAVRVAFAPEAVRRLVDEFARGCSEHALRTGTSSLQRIYRDPLVDRAIRWVERGRGLAPHFDRRGRLKIDETLLVDGGRGCGSLVSARSSSVFGATANGADDDERPVALAMQPGVIDDPITTLDRGIWVGSLHDATVRADRRGRFAGVTSVGAFWVEEGELRAPIPPTRIGGTIEAALGEAFLGATRESRTLIVTEPEAIGGVRRYDVPGILVAELDVEPA